MSFFSTLFGSPSKSNSSSASGYAALPEFAESAWEELISQAQGLSDNSDMFKNAPFTGLQQEGFDAVSTPYTPQSNADFEADISKYTNPFTQNVIDATNKNLREQADQEINSLGANATKVGAFGGDRQGVAQSLIMRDLNNTIAGNDAALNAAAFDTAATNANNEYQTAFTNKQNQGINQINAGTQQQQTLTQNQQAPANALSWLQQILAGLNSSTAESTSRGASQGIVSQLAGLASGVGNAAMAAGA